MGEYLGRNSIKPITDGLRDFKNLAAKNPLLKDETYSDELNTESGDIPVSYTHLDVYKRQNQYGKQLYNRLPKRYYAQRSFGGLPRAASGRKHHYRNFNRGQRNGYL